MAILLSLACRKETAEPAKKPDAPAQLIEFTGDAMGGTWSVKLPKLPANVSADDLRNRVAARLSEIDGQMSIYKADSNLSRFNSSPSKDWQPVPADLARVVALARQVSDESAGAFDVTVGPLVNLWGFGPAKSGGRLGKLPADAEIEAARERVNYHRLDARLDPPALRKICPDVMVDLGAIAKGYGADAAGQILESAGAMDYLLAVGGEMRARGHSTAGRGWRIGIETPAADVRRILLTLELNDVSASTSGDYRNFFEIAGQRYCHEIDPRTGRPIPAARGPALVSVIHSSGAYADAMATALMVLGPEEGWALATKLKLAVLIVTRGQEKYEMRMTAEYKKWVVE